VEYSLRVKIKTIKLNVMDFNKFTIKSQEAVQQAQQIAQSYGHQQIENSHILKAIFEVDENVAPFIFKKIGLNIDLLKSLIDKTLESYSKVTGGEISLSGNASKMLNAAAIEAKNMKDEYVSVEHLLLAILNTKDTTSQILKDQGVTDKNLKAAIQELRKGSTVTSQSAEETYNSLNKYARNLNQLANDGKLDPVIGRDEEIRRILQILSRRTKNNPILVGEPGTGKTAIAEGLAHRIVKGDIPENLKDKTMVVLSGNGHIIDKFGIPERAFKLSGGALYKTIFLAPVGTSVKLSNADFIWSTPNK